MGTRCWWSVACLGCLALAGCANRDDESTDAAAQARRAPVLFDDELRTGLFENAQALLNTVDFGQGFEPQRQAVDRLNQWIKLERELSGWQLDPLVAGLPAPLRKEFPLSQLESRQFPQLDATALLETIWLRQAARQIVGSELRPLPRARLLFDWVVRNIQLIPESAHRRDPALGMRAPWQVMLYGEGSALERGWVFALLARQLGLQVVALAIDEDAAQGADESAATLQFTESGPRRFWCVALWHGGELYLFDPELGLPLPAFDDQGLPRGDQIATLAELRAHPDWLSQLDASVEMTYPVATVELDRVAAFIEATPTYLAYRMALVESQLIGAQQMVLSASPAKLADELQEESLTGIGLWLSGFERQQQMLSADAAMLRRHDLDTQPFLRPETTLWVGRVLYLTGRQDDQGYSASAVLQYARPASFVIAQLDANSPELNLRRIAKENASYWLGLVAFATGNYDTAERYLDLLTLQAFPNGKWTWGARYNLARTYEAQGKIDEAAALYRLEGSPQEHGNLLRARWLEAAQ